LRARRNDLDGEERWAILTGEEGTIHRCRRAYFRPATSRPAKVISKAFNAAFHRLDQRFCPLPVGSGSEVQRYRILR
jgi:hypothetical protein